MIRKIKKIFSGAFISVLAGCFVSSQIQAQTFRGWNGSESDDWSDSRNWDGGVVPTGSTDTASIRRGTPDVPNRTVLYNGATANLNRVFIGEQNSGHLTVQNGASLTTTSNVNMTNNGGLVNNGVMTVNGGLSASSTSSVRIGSGGTFNGNLTANNTSSVTINGTLNGNFTNNSSVLQNIGVNGKINGDARVTNGDQLRIAGEISGGLFNVNGNGSVVIESTATILSEGENSWIYNTADITWEVGADGSVGTLRTNRNESAAGAFDGEWRYDTSTLLTVVLDAYDPAVYGETISLELLSNIQNPNAFGQNVKFMLNGQDVTSDFTYRNRGNFDGTVPVPEPGTCALLAGCLGFAVVLVRRARAQRR